MLVNRFSAMISLPVLKDQVADGKSGTMKLSYPDSGHI
jgi:hypothetical protein